MSNRTLITMDDLCVKFVVPFISLTRKMLSNVPAYWYNWTTYVYIGLTLFFLYHIYSLLFAPMNRIRKLCDVGYLTDGQLSKRELANNVQKRRRVGDLPPVYPNGWFGILESFTIKKKEVKNIDVLGLNLAAFRDEKGEIHVLNAYCPHMGANMAAGGRVIGNELECPFHAWRFRGDDGKCTHIPYCEKVPSIAKVKSWPVMEINGWVYLWYHAEGRDPYWFPPEIENITNGSWTFRGRSEHYINAHIEEIPENGADVVHLAHVHGPLFTSGADIRYMWNKLWNLLGHHVWNAEWKQQASPNEHIGEMTVYHSIKIANIWSSIEMSVKARQIGPGIVYLDFDSFLLRGVLIMSLTPIEPLVQKMVHNLYVHWTHPTFIGKLFLLAEATQVERDIMIWNNKQYESKPLFVKSAEDALMARHRRWYSQFYSENSPRFKFQKDGLDW